MANTTGKKFGGREKGTPNKTTAEVREAFKLFISSNIDDFDKWLEEIAQQDKVKAFDIIIRLSEFVIPKIQRTELEGGDKAIKNEMVSKVIFEDYTKQKK